MNLKSGLKILTMSEPIKNASLYLLQIAISGALMLVLMPIISKYLSPNDFGMFILAYDQHKFSNKENTEFVGLDELLSRSDVISLHLPLNKHTNQMLDQNLFPL